MDSEIFKRRGSAPIRRWTNQGQRCAWLTSLLVVACVFASIPGNAAGEDDKRRRSKQSDGNPQGAKGAADVLLSGKITNESGQPAAEADVRFFAYGKEVAHAVADDNGEYQLRFNRYQLWAGIFNGEGLGETALLASAKDGASQSFANLLFFLFGFGGRGEAVKQSMVLKPSRKAMVRVVDRKGRPVEGAHVSAVVSFAMPKFHSVTGRDGRATFTLPADAPVKYVYAFKSKFGFQIKQGLMESESLVLSGARERRVRVLDEHGLPLSGVSIRPRHIELVTGTREIEIPENLDGKNLPAETITLPETLILPGREFEDLQVKVDDDGIATFDWIPETPSRSVTGFEVVSNNYCQIADDPKFQDDGWARDLSLRVVRKVKVTGKVQLPNGRPAAGVSITASGTDGLGVRFDDSVVTDAAGRFTLPVRPNLNYLFTAFDDDNQLGAKPKAEVAVEGQSQQLSPFVLQPATRVSGQLNVPKGTNQAPAGISMVLQIAKDIKDLKNPDEFSKISSVARLCRADADGRFQVFLGPGDYAFTYGGPEGKIKRFSVTDEKEIELKLDDRTP